MDMEHQIWWFAIAEKFGWEIHDDSVSMIKFLYDNCKQFEDNKDVILALKRAWEDGKFVGLLHGKAGIDG